MRQRYARRSWLAFVLLASASVVNMGCSTKPTPQPRAGSSAISHADADDVAQMIATTVSADNGGWYSVVEAICDTLAKPLPSVVADAPPARVAALSSVAPNRVANTFELTRPGSGISYHMEVGYFNGAQVTSTRTQFSDDMNALVSASGGSFASANGIDGTYGCHTYTVSTSTDSFFVVSNLAAASGDTIEFAGQFYDSAFALVHSSIATNASPRLWFLGPDNFFDYVLRVPKNRLATAPYPVASGSEINWVIEAKGLGSVVREDYGFDLLLELRMTFDGTNEGRLSIGNIQPDPDWEFTYRVNLDTGKITRTN